MSRRAPSQTTSGRTHPVSELCLSRLAAGEALVAATAVGVVADNGGGIRPVSAAASRSASSLARLVAWTTSKKGRNATRRSSAGPVPSSFSRVSVSANHPARNHAAHGRK